MRMFSGLLVLCLGFLWVGPLVGAAEPEPLLSRLARQRRDAARKTYETMWTNYREGRAAGELLYRWSRRWLDAERQIHDKPAEQVAALEAHLDRMRRLEALVQRVQRSGQTTVDEVSAAEYYRAEAEIWLLQARDKKRGR